MKKRIAIAALSALTVLSVLAVGVGAQARPGNKPDATIQAGSVQTSGSVKVVRSTTNTGSRVSDAELSVPFTVELKDPATQAVLRQLPIDATVNLASVTSKNQDFELFMADAKPRLANAVANASVVMSDPDIEEFDIQTDANGDVTSIPMQVNVLVTVGRYYSDRVRINIEGLDYTNLDPFNTDVNTLFADIENNALVAFTQ